MQRCRGAEQGYKGKVLADESITGWLTRVHALHDGPVMHAFLKGMHLVRHAAASRLRVIHAAGHGTGSPSWKLLQWLNNPLKRGFFLKMWVGPRACCRCLEGPPRHLMMPPEHSD